MTMRYFPPINPTILNAIPWVFHSDADIHTEDPDAWIVLLTLEERMVRDTKGEIPLVIERVRGDLVLPQLQGVCEERLRCFLAQGDLAADWHELADPPVLAGGLRKRLNRFLVGEPLEH